LLKSCENDITLCCTCIFDQLRTFLSSWYFVFVSNLWVFNWWSKNVVNFAKSPGSYLPQQYVNERSITLLSRKKEFIGRKRKPSPRNTAMAMMREEGKFDFSKGFFNIFIGNNSPKYFVFFLKEVVFYFQKFHIWPISDMSLNELRRAYFKYFQSREKAGKSWRPLL
jgi:hypothetical protein